MDKPRIIILMHYMELGGAEMALLGLLHALDPEKVDVDLFIYDHRGPLMKHIPEWINLLPEIKAYKYIERPIAEALRVGQYKVVSGRLLAKYKHKKYKQSHKIDGDDMSLLQFIGQNVTPFLPKINNDIEYDLCISFLTPHNIGRDKVRAKKRLAWIHTDYSKVHVNPDIDFPVWFAYDNIASISTYVTESFIKVFPTLKDKILPIENIIPENYVKQRAQEFDANDEMKSSVKLLSIGRFCYPKNFDSIPSICKHLKELGLKEFKWYIIGYGADEGLIRTKIAEAGVEDTMVILGKKENPYPYIKACDIYVQPSRYEGKSITVREAQILGKPVVITAYPTASSQVQDNIDGIIVPLDNERCACGIASLIHNSALKQSTSEYCREHDFANQSEVEKIYQILS